MIIRMQTEPSQPKPNASPAFLAWRLLALVYDVVIAIAILMLTSGLILLINQGKAIEPGSVFSYIEFFVFWAVLGLYAVCSWRFGGQTLGMRPWRLFVVDAQGKNASWRQLILRYLLASSSGGLVLLWSLFEPEKRGLHDLVSRTYFVRINPAKSA
jgi:uncharacterized RDD family membrane protein YckC